MSVTIQQVAPFSRREFYMSRPDGYWTTEKRYDERRTYKFDLSDWLDSGETFSSVTTDTTGVTEESTTTLSSAGVLDMDISGTGTLVAKCTTSASRILEVPIRWLATDSPPEDYR